MNNRPPQKQQAGKQLSTTMVYPIPNLNKALNPIATNSLEQYGGVHQFASINQSLLMRNLNFSLLQGELEHEAALEDMHMFFVAFNKR